MALYRTLQRVHVSLILGSPKLDAAPCWVSPGRAEGKGHLPQPGLMLLRMSLTFFTTRRSGSLRSVWCPPGLKVVSGKLLPRQSARTAAGGCLSSSHSYTDTKKAVLHTQFMWIYRVNSFYTQKNKLWNTTWKGKFIIKRLLNIHWKVKDV